MSDTVLSKDWARRRVRGELSKAWTKKSRAVGHFSSLNGEKSGIPSVMSRSMAVW